MNAVFNSFMYCIYSWVNRTKPTRRSLLGVYRGVYLNYCGTGSQHLVVSVSIGFVFKAGPSLQRNSSSLVVSGWELGAPVLVISGAPMT